MYKYKYIHVYIKYLETMKECKLLVELLNVGSFTFRHSVTNQLLASAALVADLAPKALCTTRFSVFSPAV